MSSEQRGLAITGLNHYYGDRRALCDISFSIEPATITALLGPNGSGKTTLFQIVTTLLPTNPGHVSVFGHDVVREANAARRSIGVVFQSPALDERLTVTENLRTHGQLYGLRGTQLISRIRATLGLVTLDGRAGDLVGTLSGGLRRRVEIAKALLPQPRLLILDEPSTGLDPGARRELWKHLQRLRDSLGTTVLLTTHLMNEAADSDTVAVLHEGRMVARGTPRELVAEVGGDVILVTARDVETLARDIRTRFDQPVDIVDGRVRIERNEGRAFISELVDAFDDRIDSVNFGKPTLEDVFLHYTGHRWN